MKESARADFDNYRRRTEKEMKETEEKTSRKLVAQLLSVLDEMDLAMKHTEGDAGWSELQEGIRMVRKNLYSSLESVGLQRIDSLGTQFDPSKHEAVAKVEGSSPGHNIVVQELRTGYSFRGDVLRPSMVKVAVGSKRQVEEHAGD